MQPEQPKTENSDSEDDPDYVPPADANNSDSSDDERDAKRIKTSPPPLTAEEEAEKKRTRDELWASFQASVSQPSASSASRSAKPKLVKIEKRYRYAGEEVIDVVEVPEDSEEAKKWPLWRPEATIEESSAKDDDSSPTTADPSTSAAEIKETESTNPPEAVASSVGSTSVPRPPLKRPGPRKPKTKLAPLPEPAKAKKLTTLDKSAMDWKSHVSTAPDAALKDELEANRRGGGYLEKVEFLHRVEERKDQAFEANKASKRRRG